ncbi:MAG: outer membrane lipoprotein-sorting protein [Myxococcales bacterium]|nr:outer membrane lipoprotein-sorting protein [Myxococcales bacterium]
MIGDFTMRGRGLAIRSSGPLGRLGWLVALLSIGFGPTVAAEELSGKAIYQQLIDNRLRSSYAEQRFTSTDPGGDVQELHFWSRFKDYRVEGGPGPSGIVSKTMMKFTYPKDKRDSGYLFTERHRQENDGYYYSPRRERVARVDTSRETIFATDFTLEDIAMVRVIDDATYERLPDERVEDVPVYVVEVKYLPESRPQYSKSLLYIDQEFPVPLHIKNWDLRGLRVNELELPRARVEVHEGAWVPMEVRMTDVREKTQSVLYVDKLEANPDLHDRLFEANRLSRKRP